MAVVTQPLGSSEARGSVGGYTYNTWRGRSTVKTRVAPAYTPGGAREAQKNIVQAAGQHWREITPEQRTAWENYARLHPDISWTGQPKRLPGYHWFVRINTRVNWLLQTWLDDPPTDTCHALVLNPRFDYFQDEIQLYFDPYPTGHDIDYVLEAWIAGPHSPGRNPTIKDAKRDGQNPYTYAYYPFYGHPQGNYTLFARPLRLNGVAGQFVKVAGYYPGYP